MSTLPGTSLAIVGKGNVGSLSRQLTELLAGRISSGELKPGERFPTELDLIEQYNVSRTVVREAISSLKADGLVETRHGIGTFVLEPTHRARTATDPNEVKTIKEILLTLEFRMHIEPEAAGLAAARRSKQDVAELRTALQKVEKLRAAQQDSTVADFEFHQRIAAASGNRYFLDTLNFLGPRSIPRAQVPTDEFQGLPRPRFLEVVNKQHKAILDGIVSGSPEKAHEAMREHLAASYERLRKAINSRG